MHLTSDGNATRAYMTSANSESVLPPWPQQLDEHRGKTETYFTYSYASLSDNPGEHSSIHQRSMA